MALFLASLNSGSNGNCYYVGNNEEAVLIDVGISCKETEKRMAKINLNMQTVKAIFISHEHADHIRGVEVLSRKYKLPVYLTPATLKRCPFFHHKAYAVAFTTQETIAIGSLTVTPFAKYHDAVDPCSFVVEGNGIKVAVITDIGIACKQVIHYFKQCHAAILESNYDEQMLECGPYPLHLKKRIRGGKGHLSNAQALQLFKLHKPSFMTHLVLGHLSRENNNPDLVKELFSHHAAETKIVVASRYEPSPVFAIDHNESPAKVKPFTERKPGVQMNMFEAAKTN
jgi:phosphoribosyl 1,2-cyclic phosphodiesterase